MTDNIPAALVVSWNAGTFRARCPYCLRTHGHGFAPETARHEQGSRRSDCHDPGGDYRVQFHDQSLPGNLEYGWEFDRRYPSFVTTNSQGRLYDPTPSQPFRSLLPHLTNLPIQSLEEDETNDREDGEAYDSRRLAAQLDALALNTADRETQPPGAPVGPEVDEIWEGLMATTDHRRKLYIGACTNRDLPELRRLMSAYPEDDFPSLTDDTGGNGILFAATEENALETMQFLLDHGAEPDLPDHYGRTPLMEAALWGRHDAVLLLTNTRRVDLHAQDANGLSALDLSLPTERNQGERSERAGSVYREPIGAHVTRQRIEHHLRNLTSSNQRSGQNRTLDSFFQRRANGTISVYRPVLEMAVPIRGLTKAFAELNRGGAYPLVQAMSGCSHPGWTNVLDNEIWTERASQLRSLLGMGTNQSFASHVEPQLLAYILYYHSLLDIEGSSEWSLDLDWGEPERMREVAPEYTLNPVITVNKNGFCPECQIMKDLMSARFPWLNVRFRCVGDQIGSVVRTEDWNT